MDSSEETDGSGVSTPSLLLPNTDSFELLQEYAVKLIQADSSIQIRNVPCSTPVKELLSLSPTLTTNDNTLTNSCPEDDTTLLNYSSDDTVKDPTYKMSDDIDQIVSDESLCSPPKKIKKNIATANSPASILPQHCEFENCVSEVYSSCNKCYSLLCYEHFMNEESYGNCFKHKLGISTNRDNSDYNSINNTDQILIENVLPCDENPEQITFQHCEYEECSLTVFGSCEKCLCLLCLDHFENYIDCTLHLPYSSEIQVEATKKLNKKTTTKILRNTGQQYCNVKQNIVQARQVKPPCSEKCKLNCGAKFPESVRQQFFSRYWALGDLNRQRDFIHKHLQEIVPKYRYEKPACCRKRNRTLNHAFYFTYNNEKIRVCKLFFKATLDINDRTIRTVIEKSNEDGIIAEDARGKHDKHPKKQQERTDVHKFIDNIPRIESHYLRAQTTKQFIDGGLTITQIYDDYKADCIKSGKKYVSKTTFTQIFHSDFNISFFIPKKDQCETCEAFKNSNESEKRTMQASYDRHLKEKELSREEKVKDKSKVGPNYVVACYDLEAVLPSPRGEISLFYYISKVATYNFTISELKTTETSCYVWHEGQGNRGVTEIGSCVYKYLEAKSNSVSTDDLEVVFYSDNCCGQQKNKIMIATYIYAVQKLNIKSITHKFLIKGHTQNEGDAVHSVIEKQIKKALKSGPIYVPDEYVCLIKTAKKNPPYYKVEQLCYEDFYDMKKMAEEIGGNFTKTDENETIKIADIKIIKVTKDDPNAFLVKTSYEQNAYMRVNLRRSRKQYKTPSHLQPAYSEKLPVCEKKKQSILKLINSNHIPKVHFDFYNNL